MSLRDELLKRINSNSGPSGGVVSKFRVHIPSIVNEELERLPADALDLVERDLDILAELAAQTTEHDSVWVRLRDESNGAFRHGCGAGIVYFDVDRRTRTLLVIRVKRQG